VDRICFATILIINNLKLAAIQAVDAKRRRSDGQGQLNDARVELRESNVGTVIDADDVASAQLELRSTVRSAVDMIVFVKRQVRTRIEPVLIGIVGAPIVDFTYDQADAGSTYDSFIRQDQRTRRDQ
jgi:hypothetical protein